MDSGYGNGGVPFEYTVAESKSVSLMLKKSALLLLYILVGVGCLLVATAVRYFVYLVAFVPIVIWILVFFTWRWTQVEYEYSFFAGKLTVSRILGGRSRKRLCEVLIRELAAVLPYEEEYRAKAEQFGAEKSIYAVSSLEAENLYLLLFAPEGEKRQLLCMELNEKALKILKYYNMAAVTLRK